MLGYAFTSAIAVMLANWHGKSISQSTDITDINFLYPMSYVYDPTNTKTETKGEISL